MSPIGEEPRQIRSLVGGKAAVLAERTPAISPKKDEKTQSRQENPAAASLAETGMAAGKITGEAIFFSTASMRA